MEVLRLVIRQIEFVNSLLMSLTVMPSRTILRLFASNYIHVIDSFDVAGGRASFLLCGLFDFTLPRVLLHIAGALSLLHKSSHIYITTFPPTHF